MAAINADCLPLYINSWIPQLVEGYISFLEYLHVCYFLRPVKLTLKSRQDDNRHDYKTARNFGVHNYIPGYTLLWLLQINDW